MEEEEEEEDKKRKMVKRHIILRKRATPKTVNLPNGRSFVSKWERISRKQLPINIRINRVRTIGARRNNRQICFNLAREGFRKIKQKRKAQQSGKGLGSNLIKAGFDPGSKALGSEIGKKLINKGIDSIPNVSKFGTSKIKNKTVNHALNSEIADLVFNEAQNRLKKKTTAQTCLVKKNGWNIKLSN